jgi:hypothetical protein
MGAVNLDKMVEKNKDLLECERCKIEIWKCERRMRREREVRLQKKRPEAL